MVITSIIAGWTSTGMAANPTRDQLNWGNVFFRCPLFTPENMNSRDRFGRPVSRVGKFLTIMPSLFCFICNNSEFDRCNPRLQLGYGYSCSTVLKLEVEVSVASVSLAACWIHFRDMSFVSVLATIRRITSLRTDTGSTT